MKTMKKRGFTLVELLVVIAILAILATVSVVGYTAFIERAYVSNDENIAAQMNQFLVAVKADSNGEYYNQEITPENAREIIAHALNEGGLEGKLEPQSAEYGYHYYYDLKEEKVVVLNDSDAINPNYLFNRLLGMFTTDASIFDLENNPATCFTKKDTEFTKYGGTRYVFLDTEGSDLADLVNMFYNVNSAADFAELQTMVTNIKTEKGDTITEFATLLNKSIFVGASGSYMTDTEDEKTLFFGKTMYTDKFVGTAPVGAFANPSSAITVAGTIQFFATNSLKFETGFSGDDSSTEVLVFNLSLSELTKRVDPDFTNVVFKLSDGKRYVCENGGIRCLDDGTSVAVECKNPMQSFDIIANATEDGKVQSTGTNAANVAWDGTITLSVTNVVGEHDDEYDFVSSTSVNWKITSVVVGDTSITTGTNSYVTIDPNTGALTFVSECDVINVTATATAGSATQNFVINVARIKTGSVTLGGKTLTEGTIADVTLVKTPNVSSYTIELVDGYDASNATNITFNKNITWTFAGEGGVEASGTDSVVLTGGQGSGTLTIKVGPYLTFTVNLTVEDTANFALQPKNMNNFTYLGSKNVVYLSDLFELKGTVPSGAQLVVYNGAVQTGDSYMTPKRGKLTNQINASVTNNTQTLNISSASDLEDIELEFTGEDLDNSIRIAVIHNGVRISEDIEVYIVDAYNIREYEDFITWTVGKVDTGDWKNCGKVEVSAFQSENKSELSGTTYSVSGNTVKVIATYVKYTGKSYSWSGTTATKYTQTVTYNYTIEGIADGYSNVAHNIVLLDNISMPASGYSVYMYTENGLTVGGSILRLDGKTLYGNCFTFDITNGATKGVNGIIVLNNAHMKDTKVVGEMYPQVAISGMDEYGTNAVHALGTSTINNCYIANCRAPLATGYENANTTTHNITVSNTVLYGGILANIEHRGGTLTFGENVLTINQPHTKAADTSAATDKKVGLGITIWLEAPMADGDTEYTKIEGIENITQYNFVPSSYTNLPTISISAAGISANISTQDAFTQAFNDSTIYKFGSGDVKYINAGVVCEDIGQSNSELITSIIEDKVIPYGDRTGLSGNTNANVSYSNITVPVALEKWGVSIDASSAPVHFYTMTETDANKSVFAASANAECIYSPWEQSFTVETDTKTTTTTCKAYGFDSKGSIVPTEEWLEQLMTSVTTDKE